MEAYQQELGGAMSIPEILFGNSFVELVHEASGAALRFTALDALKGWQARAAVLFQNVWTCWFCWDIV